jgi:hypothetical protein
VCTCVCISFSLFLSLNFFLSFSLLLSLSTLPNHVKSFFFLFEN